MTRIVVGVSTSLPGLAALRYAVAEGRRRGLTAITVVRTWPDPDHGRKPPPPWAADLARASTRVIDEAVSAAFGMRPARIVLLNSTPRGRPGPALVDLVDSTDDLIVLGSRRRRWLGSGVARHCIRLAPCPVIVVPCPAPASRFPAPNLDDELRRLTGM
ncbi:MAG TPA: universal stress protein [Actinoplanes sp.]|nr:universal stress protein [Actinoplanes sp.]